MLCKGLTEYQKKRSIDDLIAVLVTIFQDKCLHYLLKGKTHCEMSVGRLFVNCDIPAGMKRFLLPSHKDRFDELMLNYS